MLYITRRIVRDIPIIKFTGEIRFNKGDFEMREDFAWVLRAGYRSVIIDLADLSFIDSAGVGELIAFHKRASMADASLVILGLTEKVHELFIMTKLVDIFIIVWKEDDALKLLEAAATADIQLMSLDEGTLHAIKHLDRSADPELNAIIQASLKRAQERERNNE